MSARALFLGDGPSDQPLGQHAARIAQRAGCELDVVSPDLRRLNPPQGRNVAARLKAVLNFDDAFDLVIVHRDAEAAGRDARLSEIQQGVAEVRPTLPALPVIPIRMTEAWLLMDEAAIRRVAGRPSGTSPLNLPQIPLIEQLADPKQALREALERASGAMGRRLKRFRRDFPAHRRRLLEELDHHGPVSQLSAWQNFESDVASVVAAVSQEPRNGT